MTLRSLLAIVGFAGLAGCATAPPGAMPSRDGLFQDSAFKPPTVRIVPGDAIAMSPEMQRFADGQARSEIHQKGLRDGLISALYSKGQLQLEYDSARTRNAAEAFDAKRGNCMSLVLMTAAFARYYSLPMTFNSVYIEEMWTRSGGLYFVAGHVNVTLARIATPTNSFVWGSDNLLTIDFLPPGIMRGQRSRPVEEATIIAMYLNNRAAEALTEGDIDNAYWWARAAIETDPRWLAAYNTLAVLYRRKGLGDHAESTLRMVLEREPLNVQSLSNLALVLNDAGRHAEAQVFTERLAQIQPIPPYQFFDQGLAALRAGDFAAARELFRKEIARDAYVSEFHFWLGVASYRMGDVSAAKGEITRALQNSATVKDKALYGAKLAWLNEQRRQSVLERR
ncbi:tetratricopeptide repeat protein [Roseateles sp.]|uniref:tetratricopeptide repeat protein n=1 Tax=Roseateles sp. TaxID=1971397 RepID=UPI003BAAE3CB